MTIPENSRILGVDPGTLKMGYGVLDSKGESVQVVTYGVLKAPSTKPLEQRLALMFHNLSEVFEQWCPTTIAVEEPFVGGNPRSALSVGRAQGLVLLIAAQQGISVTRYTPAEVKYSVTNYGRGSKEQMQKMVSLLLGIKDTLTSDAADALAVCLCHLHNLQVPTGDQDNNLQHTAKASSRTLD